MIIDALEESLGTRSLSTDTQNQVQISVYGISRGDLFSRKRGKRVNPIKFRNLMHSTCVHYQKRWAFRQTLHEKRSFSTETTSRCVENRGWHPLLYWRMSCLDIQAALNWICEHQDDDDAAEPIPEATLRALYGRRRQARVVARPELVQQLIDMGFNEEHVCLPCACCDIRRAM